MSEARKLDYWYAIIDITTGECVGIETSVELITPERDPSYVLIPGNIPEYEYKYYLNGAWYEDAEGTIPWSPEG